MHLAAFATVKGCANKHGTSSQHTCVDSESRKGLEVPWQIFGEFLTYYPTLDGQGWTAQARPEDNFLYHLAL